jgi:AcrR family transcriptional regulator
MRREGYAPDSLVVGQRGARTRQRIVDEALRLFGAHGFHATSVEGIARAAGTSRATLYQYFESKEQIFIELLEECGGALMRVARRIGPLGPSRVGFDNLHWWLGEWAWVCDRYATMFVQWANVDTPGTAVRSLVTEFTRNYNARIAERLVSSGIRDVDPLDAATAMSGVVLRFNYFRQMGLVPHRPPEALLDGLAVSVQLMLFPDTRADVLTGVVEAARRSDSPRVRPGAGPAWPVPARPLGAGAAPGRQSAEWADRRAGLRPRAAVTVRQIIDAGAALFAEHGYHRTGIDDIVSRAGLARGTFYKYFNEKLDLLLQLTHECAVEVQDLAGDFGRVDPTAAGGGRSLRAWLTRYMEFHTRYSGVIRTWVEGTSNDPRLLAAADRTIAAMLEAATRVLGRVTRSYPFDPEIAATFLGAALERIPEAAAQQDPGCSRERVLELMVMTLERGLFTGDTTRPVDGNAPQTG